jgi:hypothetical protein
MIGVLVQSLLPIFIPSGKVSIEGCELICEWTKACGIFFFLACGFLLMLSSRFG